MRDKVAALKRRRIGPADWTAHWFRHCHATALLISGVPEWVVSRRLGHTHVQTTLIINIDRRPTPHKKSSVRTHRSRDS